VTTPQRAPQTQQKVAIRSLEDYDRLVSAKPVAAPEPQVIGREVSELILRDLRRFAATAERRASR
jgi:hypothetical protein